MKFSGRKRIYAAVVVMIFAIYAGWAPKGMSRISSAPSSTCVMEVSPKGTYRVDICRPALPYISFTKEMPRFVRFYDQRSQKIIGESNIIDMAGRGEVFWPNEGRLSILVGGGDDSPEIKVKAVDGSK
jgi:hypothetical protein